MIRVKILYLSIIFVSLIIISGSVYYLLGGFEPVKIYELEGVERAVLGREYLGKYDAQVLDSLMRSSREDIQKGKVKGRLTLVDYHMPSEDSVHFFIGASTDDKLAQCCRKIAGPHGG
jgi:hypothetical protein